MRRALSPILLASALMPLAQAHAQMHKVSKPDQVVRAVGVYEWTGDLKKPTGSRLIPVTVFIDGNLEDAGVYLARPIPFALTPGNEYELQQAGVAHGSVDLTFARHLQTSDSAYEDGWFGYGSYKAPAPPKKEPVLRASKTQPTISSSKDDSRPHFSGKQPASADGSGPGKSDPAQTGKDSPNPDATEAAKKTPGADDPDRPTMRRRSSSSDTSKSTTDPADASATPANDPDRPTLRRHSASDAKGKDADSDVAGVTSVGSLNNDPDRPRLQRGAHSTVNDTDLPKLVGTPKDLHQMVAVSDPANRPVHDFTRSWQDESEHTAVLAKMQALARAQLSAYVGTPGTPAAPTSTSTPKPASHLQSSTAVRSRTRSTRPAAKPATTAPQPLLDEQLKAYTLSYGGAPTYIYTAHTAGTGADLRYVTVVAQADINGDLRPAIGSVTDAAHLDRTPQMRFVDVVDAEASNRASLLFELRSQNERQFALYQVIGSRAQPLFTTGTTQ